MGTKQNIQDPFFNSIRKEKIQVNVFLCSGIKLQGYIKSFDQYCIYLINGSDEQLIYKHATATVVPTRPVNLRDDKQSFQGPPPGSFEEDDLL